MSIVARERPGVYSDYEASGVIFANKAGKTVGIVALAGGVVGQIYTITKVSDAKTIFGEDGLMVKLCQTALENGAYKIAAVSAGSSADNYQTAFDALKAKDDICAIICDSQSVAVQALLKESVVFASENLKERIGIVSASKTETLSTWAENFNNERIVLIAQQATGENGEELSGCLLAAALAGVVSKKDDPSTSFNGVNLEGVYGVNTSLSEDDIDEYINLGITPFEVVSNKVEIIRAVTSKTTLNGVDDKTFKELNTILIIDTVIKDIRKTLNNSLSGLKNNSVTRSSIQSQATLKLQEFLDENIIEAYDQVVVSQWEDDISICIVSLSFTVSRGLNQIHITASIKV